MARRILPPDHGRVAARSNFHATKVGFSESLLRVRYEPVRVVTFQFGAESIHSCLMSKHFRLWAIDQQLLLPPSVQDFVPEGQVSRFILGLVRDSLDLAAIAASYTSGLGQPPFDPAFVTSLVRQHHTGPCDPGGTI
jgi:hypothetical protein